LFSGLLVQALHRSQPPHIVSRLNATEH
jgi:hypothetical protein